MFTLVPEGFFDPAAARQALAEVAPVAESDQVFTKKVPQFGAVLIYNVSGGADVPPEIFSILQELPTCKEYNKLLCSWKDGELSLAVGQGRSLLLANSYPAQDFTTAEYFIFLSLNSLQLNPEISTICWRNGLDAEDEMSLYRYFKAVVKL